MNTEVSDSPWRLSRRVLPHALPLWAFGLLAAVTLAAEPSGETWSVRNPVWRGLHLSAHSDSQAADLIQALPALQAAGVNVVVLEVNHGFEFRSHPDLRGDSFITRARAGELSQAARERGIRLIPQFNCLGHQSWAKQTAPLLRKHPEFDETPGQFPENKGIYCRSWCPQHPDVNRVVFALIDELIEGFAADAFHVGMDEVFLIASEHCSRCKGGDPAKLFARAVNDLHTHLVREKKVEMLIWGDRLLDAKTLGYSEWEASRNHTEPAIDLIPKDIIVCDWHYGKKDEYGSIPLLQGKGFRVWPTGWHSVEAATALSRYAHQHRDPRVLGYLCTTWGKVKIPDMAAWPALIEPIKPWR